MGETERTMNKRQKTIIESIVRNLNDLAGDTVFQIESERRFESSDLWKVQITAKNPAYRVELHDLIFLLDAMVPMSNDTKESVKLY